MFTLKSIPTQPELFILIRCYVTYVVLLFTVLATVSPFDVTLNPI